MEVASAVASITGIIGFAGQAIDGITKLRKLFQGYANASKSVAQFLRDLNSLIQTLEQAREIAAKLKAASGTSTVADGVLASLEIQLEDCSKDVHFWVRMAGESRPSFSNRPKAVFKRFLVAVNKDQIDAIYRDIANHQTNILVKLSVIGRSLDVEHSSGLKDLNSRVEETSKLTLAALEGLQGPFSQDFFERGSPISLASLSSSLSRIENILGSQSRAGSWQGSVNSRHGSASSVGSYSQNEQFNIRGKGYGGLASGIEKIGSWIPSKPRGEAPREVTRIQANIGILPSGSVCTNCFAQRCRQESMTKMGSAYLKFEPLCHQCHSYFEKHSSARPIQFGPSTVGYVGIDRAPSGAICTNCFAQRCRYESMTVLGSSYLKHEPLCLPCGEYFAQNSTARPLEFLTVDTNYTANSIQTMPEQPKKDILPIPLRQSNLRPEGEADPANSFVSTPNKPAALPELDSKSITTVLKDPGPAKKFDIYLSLMLQRATLRSQYFMFQEMAWCIPTESQISNVKSTIQENLKNLELEIRNARAGCWKEGHNLDDIESFFARRPTGQTDSGWSACDESELCGKNDARDEDENHVVSRRVLPPNNANPCATKQDRVNSWMLQKLRSSDTEIKIHKSILWNCLETRSLSQDLIVDTREWSRLVLKHWFLDGAGSGFAETGLSTNGAVDSAGLPHDARVDLNLDDLEDEVLETEAVNEVENHGLESADLRQDLGVLLHSKGLALRPKAKSEKGQDKMMAGSRTRIWADVKTKLGFAK